MDGRQEEEEGGGEREVKGEIEGERTREWIRAKVSPVRMSGLGGDMHSPRRKKGRVVVVDGAKSARPPRLSVHQISENRLVVQPAPHRQTGGRVRSDWPPPRGDRFRKGETARSDSFERADGRRAAEDPIRWRNACSPDGSEHVGMAEDEL